MITVTFLGHFFENKWGNFDKTDERYGASYWNDVPLFSAPKFRMKEWWWMSILFNLSHPQFPCIHIFPHNWEKVKKWSEPSVIAWFPLFQQNSGKFAQIGWLTKFPIDTYFGCKNSILDLRGFIIIALKTYFQAPCPKSGPIESNLFIADDNECEQNMDDKWKFEIQQNFVQMVERLLFQNPPNLIFVWKRSSRQQQLKCEMIFKGMCPIEDFYSFT